MYHRGHVEYRYKNLIFMDPYYISKLTGISITMFVIGLPVFVFAVLLYLLLQGAVSATGVLAIKIAMWVSGICCLPCLIIMFIVVAGVFAQEMKERGVK